MKFFYTKKKKKKKKKTSLWKLYDKLRNHEDFADIYFLENGKELNYSVKFCQYIYEFGGNLILRICNLCEINMFLNSL